MQGLKLRIGITSSSELRFGCSWTLWKAHVVKNLAISHSVEIGAHICAEKLSVSLSVLIAINMGVSNTLGCNVLCLNMVISWHVAGCVTNILCLSLGI